MGRACLLSTPMCLMTVSYGLFLLCYFPVKNSIEGCSSHSKMEQWIKDSVDDKSWSFEHVRHFDKTIIMLVDALRADFVFHENSVMKFVHSSLQKVGNKGFVAEAHPPTVTLPRIKALTTGGIPGFVDVVLNFGSTSLLEDNILMQMVNDNRKVVFFGDDTWLRLFPKYFTRSDGTTSFFVNDFTEVDNNVTRHLSTELQNGDFDVMILHYLGLDHIGHTAGPYSPLVAPKLHEMDDIVKALHLGLTKLQKPGGLPNLLVLCGDHGMSDQGSHGGSSYSETRTPVVFLSTDSVDQKKNGDGLVSQKEIDQIDLVPTLSVMMGLPVPQNNLGKVITNALSMLTVEQVLEALLKNSVQILQVLKQNVAKFTEERGYELFERATKGHCNWLRMSNASDVKHRHAVKLIQQYSDAMVAMTQKISASLTTYDMYGLVVAIVILWEILFILLLTFNTPTGISWSSQWIIISLLLLLSLLFCHMTVCTSKTAYSDLLCGGEVWSLCLQCVVIVTVIYLTVYFLQLLLKTKRREVKVLWYSDCLGWYLIGGTVLHSVSLLSSSFVEEEHQTWYFLSMTVHLIMAVYILQKRVNTNKTVRSKLQSDNCTQKVPGSPVSCSQVSDLCEDQQCNEEQDTHSCTYQSYRQNTNFTRLKKKAKNEAHCYFEKDKNQLSNESIKMAASKYPNRDGFYNRLPLQEIAATFIILLLSRVLRSWNQTGNKWLDQPDIGDWLVRPENNQILSVFVLASMILISMLKWKQLPWIQRVVFVMSLFATYWYRAVSGVLFSPIPCTMTQGIFPSRLAFLAIAIFVASEVFHQISKRINDPRQSTTLQTDTWSRLCGTCHTAWILLMVLLMRPHNIILVAMVTLQEDILYRYIYPWLKALSPFKCTLIFLWMGQALFFYQGNSNSISTVDVSAGYIGLDDYNPVAVGILLALSTYSGLIFWLLALLKIIIQSATDEKHSTTKSLNTRLASHLYNVCHTLAVSCCLPLAIYTVLVVVLRHHLFVWTVFSPKLLYEGMNTLVLSIFSLGLITLTCLK